MDDFGNPSSIHSYGSKIRVALEEARETVAGFINADPSEIYFTSGGTEANNFVVFGISKTEFIESGRNSLLTSKAEHHCVLDAFEHLSKNQFDVKFIDVNNNTQVDANILKNFINPSVSLVSLIHINNETGSLNSIGEMAPLLKNNNSYLSTDAVQSFGKIKIDVKELQVDALCGSAHKINGPKGVGFAYVKSGTPISPLLIGGSQERNRRGGTENVAGIIGFAEAVKIRKDVMDEQFVYAQKLKDRFINGLRELDSQNIFINGGNNSSPYILSVTFNSQAYNNNSESMIMFLDINGVAASNGSACTSGTIKASHVILASGYQLMDAAGTLRFSFGAQNTIEEIDTALEVINKMLVKFRK